MLSLHVFQQSYLKKYTPLGPPDFLFVQNWTQVLSGDPMFCLLFKGALHFQRDTRKKQIEKLWLFLFLFLKALRISFFKAILRSKERCPHHLSFLSKSLLYHNRHYSDKSAATKTTLSFHVSSNSSLRTHFSLPSLFLRYLIRLTPYHIFL